MKIPNNYQIIKDYVKQATVRIFDSTKPSNFGTGFFVTSTHILTCRHVVKSMNQIRILTQSGEEINIDPSQIEYATSLDMALISLKSPLKNDYQPIALTHECQVNSKVASWGHSATLSKIGTDDTFTAEIEGLIDENKYIKFKGGDPIAGFSGSALINLETGFAIGIIPYKIDGRQASGLAIRSHDILTEYPLLLNKQTTYNITNLAEQYQINEYVLELPKSYQDTTILTDTNVTLKKIYVEPSFSVFKRSIDEKVWIYEGYNDVQKKQELFIESTENVHIVTNLWLDNLFKSDYFNTVYRNILFVLAEPGQGKTSFCYRLIYDYIEQKKQKLHTPIFFVKFRDIINFDLLFEDPIKAVFKHLQSQKLSLLSEETFYNSILILDGLDELEVFGNTHHSHTEYADRLVEQLHLHLDSNQQKMKVIITSRYYIDLLTVDNKYPVISLNEFNIDQQKKWLALYTQYSQKYQAKISEEDLDKIQTKESLNSIKELIGQPILLQLITINGLDVNQSLNRSQIYTNLFDNITQKTWDSKKRPPLLKNLTATELRRMLQILAFEVYETNNSYLSKSRIIQLLKINNFAIKNIKNNSEEDFFRALMIAFYFRKKLGEEQESDYKIEFLHKSLSEYLAAENIWHQIKSALKDDISYESLIVTFQRCFNKLLPIEIVGYLKEIIENDNNADKEQITTQLLKLTNDLYKNAFSNTNGRTTGNNHIHIFYGYGSVCAALNMTMIEDSKLGIQMYLNFLAALRQKLDLSNWKFYNLQLEGIYLPNCVLNKTVFDNCTLERATFNGSDLSYTKIINSNLEQTNLDRCQLIYTSFENSSIKKVDFRGFQFENVSFGRASLDNCNFHESTLNHVDFTKAKISLNVSFEFTTMKNVNFTNCDSLYVESFEKVFDYHGVYGLTKKFIVDLIAQKEKQYRTNQRASDSHLNILKYLNELLLKRVE